MNKPPLHIGVNELAEKILTLNKSAMDLKAADMHLALKTSIDSLRLGLGLSISEDIYTAISENRTVPIKDKKLLADSLFIAACLENECSYFDNSLLLGEYARKLFEEVGDREFLAKTYVLLGSVNVQKGDFHKALEANLQGLKIAEEDNHIENIMILLGNTGLTYWNLSMNDKAYKYILKSLEYKRQRGDKLDVAKSLNNLGLVYNSMGNFQKALEVYQEAYNMVDELGEKKGVGILLMNIAIIYEKFEAGKAVTYLYKALEAYKEAGYKKGIGECLVNLALSLRMKGDIDEALKAAEEGFLVANEIGDKRVLGFAYQEIMDVLVVKKEWDKALEYAFKCYDLRKEIGHKTGVIEICGSIGEIFLQKGEIDKALEYLHQGIQIAFETNITISLPTIYQIIAACYETKGDYKEAVLYLNKYIKERDKVFSEETQKSIANMQARFEIEQARRESEIYKLKNIDLADANKKLEEMNQEKNEFLNLVSHDLKNPLNSIYGFSNLLVEDIATLSMEEVSDFATNINISSMAMLDLVNEILNSELMDSGRYEIQNELIDLNVLVKALVGMNKFQLRQKDIKVEFDEKIIGHVFSDSNIVKQIISNLLSNAIKFSPDGKKIFINILHNKSDSSTSVEIKDEGPGLSEEDKGKMFIKFAKLSAKPTAGESSTGLGLSIVKKLTDIIGGNIICESELGEGAKFILTIPVAPVNNKK